MSLTPLPNFQQFTTHHCVTGSLRHLYAFHACPISEEMLLGLGAGVGFTYWHSQGQPPFIGGRAMPKPSMEALAAARTGVSLTQQTTRSARRAASALLDLLRAGEPVMLQVDMGFLPYFDFGTDYHFGGHMVVACGLDAASGHVLIADRDAMLHPVSLAQLAQARGSTYKPFPPLNAWYTVDCSGFHAPTPEAVLAAIQQQTHAMLMPPIRNLGVAGIYKTAELLPRWPEQMAADQVRWALFNAYIFISAVGGTGGGAFRLMFSRFLREAATITGHSPLAASAAAFERIGYAWDEVGLACQALAETGDLSVELPRIAAQIRALADAEATAWQQLDNQPSALALQPAAQPV